MCRSLGPGAWAFVLAAFAAVFAAPVLAQTVVTPATAQVFTNGQVRAVLVQGDGKVIIGGSFAVVNGVPRNSLARLNADGSVDAGWNPGVKGPVLSLAQDPAGNTYIAGTFVMAGGHTRNGLAKVSAAGTVDPVWNPNPRSQGDIGSVYVVGYDPASAALFIGGLFDEVAGQPRASIAKVSTANAGAVDPLWNPGVNTFGVLAFAFDGAGSMYVGGGFTEIASQTRRFLAKLSTSGAGTLDPTWDPAPFNTVRTLALDGANLYVGGDFLGFGTSTFRSRLARVSAGGAGAVDSWDPGASGSVLRIALDGASVYVGGTFTAVGGQARSNVARISTTGTVDGSWIPNPNGYVEALAVNASQVFVGGGFTTVGGTARPGFAALGKATGAANPAWSSVLSAGFVRTLVRDGAGRTLVGGSFAFAGDPGSVTPRANLARFNLDGTLDATFNPAPNGGVNALAVNQGGAIFVGGSFATIGGQTRSNVARLDASGNAVAGFNATANGNVFALALDDSGNIYVGGSFGSIGGQARPGLARVSAASGVADTWNPAASDGGPPPSIYALALDTSGRIYVGGTFTSIGAQAVSSLARLSTATGLADASWKPATDSRAIRTFALDNSGNVFVGGAFTTMGGQTRSNLAKLSSTTGLADASWSPNPPTTVASLVLDGSGNTYVGTFDNLTNPQRLFKFSTAGTGARDVNWNPLPDSAALAIALDGSGNVCVGGAFTTIASQPRAGYACLAPTAPTALPVFTSGSGTAFLVALPGSFTIAATGNPLPTLAHVGGALPSGITFNSSTGILSGTSAVGTVGSYSLTFRATNAVGFVDQTFILTIAPTVPAKPTLNSVGAGTAQAVLAFSAPTNDGGRPIVKYTARCTSGSETRTAEGPGSPLVVTGLTNSVSYTCAVTGTNDQGEGPQSDPGNVTPCSSCNPPPTVSVGSIAFGGQSMGTTSPPQEITITNSGATTVTVSGLSLTPQFGQASTCNTLGPGANCKAQVTFSPTVVAGALNSSIPVTGTLTIATSVGNLTVSLTGTAEKSLVTHYYRSILRRAPDTGGFTFWANEAGRVAALGANVNETWFALAAAFYRSPEYVALNRTTTEYVRDLYNTFYNRPADDGGLDFWTGQINAGLPREVVLIAFMFSPEFASFTAGIFGNATVRAELNTVIDFYRGLLARLPDDGGFNYWVSRFRVAQCQGAAAVTAEVEAISSLFVTSGEYVARARDNGQYVTDLYNAFLRRGGDLGGYQYWVNQIAAGARTRENVRVEFRNSPEFQARVNAIVAAGCAS